MKYLVVALTLIFSMSGSVNANDNGRYQMAFDSQDYVWVLDTKTGIVRICWKGDVSHTPMCSAKKDTTKDGVVN